MLLKYLTKPINTKVNKQYGSISGFVKTYWFRLQFKLGRYDQFKRVEWHNIQRLVFVCTGNICRSAFAEFVAKSVGLESISGGIKAVEGAHADQDAIMMARKMGYELKNHRTTPIMYPVLRKTDLLVAMEPWHAEVLANYMGKKYHTTLLGLWGDPKLPYIADPYACSPVYFENCFKYIEKAVHEIEKKCK